MDSKQFYRKVFSLTFPIAIQNLINVAVTSADVVMTGMVGEIALSSVSLAGQIQFVLTLFYFGISSGASVLAAQYWGKRDVRAIEQVLAISLRFALTFGLLFCCAALIFPDKIMMIFSGDAPVIEQGAAYLRVVGVSYILSSFSTIYLNILRTMERVVIAAVTYFISLLVNIAVNGVLIFGLFGFPALGVVGAAIGTIIARLVEVGITCWYAHYKVQDVHLKLSELFGHVNRELFRDFLKYSFPVTINELLWGAGTATVAVVIGHMGVSVVAANSVAQVMRQLAMVVALGVASAAGVILGQCIGAEQFEKAKIYAKKLIRISVVAGACGSVIILLARPILLNSFSLSEQASQYLSMMLFVMVYFNLAQSYNTVMIVGIYRSGGDIRFGLYLDAGALWGFAIPLGALTAFVFQWDVIPVYMLLLSDELIKLPFTTWRYKKRYWLRNITRDLNETTQQNRKEISK